MTASQPVTSSAGAAITARVISQNLVPRQPVRQLAVTPEMSKKVHSAKNPIPATKNNQVRK